ncbi:tripartite tricarboxylate transporter TctB family protein [Spiractinospora alimapuensis]|uniref:tripartite tricarboxylate transporter TctB family protein n=1 Tax=Spiractinospora alimapuensis TaxID=2820884 RepID=UPI001F197566|nr:tripartite tricarboxylate transporter TctB family protein [Spiractinospora alimapuensis]QVQ52355.1 tripartite tricarboxylate transporter TctB family protein [Spiractinospora alimapuensis]
MTPAASKRNLPDVIGGAIIATLGVVFAAGGLNYGVMAGGGQLGPGAMPTFAGLLLLAFGVGIALSGLRRGARSAERDTEERVEDPPDPPTPNADVLAGGRAGPSTDPGANDDTARGLAGDAPAPAGLSPEPGSDAPAAGGEDTTRETPTRVLALLALTACAVAAVTWFDTYLTLGALTLLILVVFERVRPLVAVGVSVALVVICYLIFSVLLNVPLPSIL